MKVKILALNWFDTMLKNDVNATQWMDQDMVNYLGASSIVNVKNND